MIDLLGNYGKFVCHVGKVMDEAGISITKMRKLTGLNHDVVKKYYYDTVTRIDKDVLARMAHILSLHGIDTSNLIEYKNSN